MPDARTLRWSAIPASVKSTPVESTLFVLICAFLISQSYLVPLAVVGPSWAVWPDLSDLVIAHPSSW
jgi:hypothetical protein